MGCFLGCFGLSKKRKRRKPAIGALITDQRHVSYKPLDSIYPDLVENSISEDSELRVKPKERSSLKIRKKVTFNLNVEAFEPIQSDYHLLKSEEEEEKTKDGLEDPKGRLLPPSDSTPSRSGSYLYPSNHRYQNCIDDEDDDEIIEDESDLEDHDDEDDYVDDDVPDESCSQEEQSCTSSVDEEVRAVGLSGNVRDMSKYVQPVLKPVQNLSQWKAVKARTAATMKDNAGSNFSPWTFSLGAKQSECKPEIQQVAVDASLSNWINTTKISCSEHVIQERTLEGSNRLVIDVH